MHDQKGEIRFFPGRALWEEEEIISFLKTPELALLGKASGEQGANKEGETQLAWSPGELGEARTFPEGSWRLASGTKQSHNEASEVTGKKGLSLGFRGDGVHAGSDRRWWESKTEAKGPPTSLSVSLKGTVGRTCLQIFSFNISHHLNFTVQWVTLRLDLMSFDMLFSKKA